MRTAFRLGALAVVFVSLVFWLFGGPHWGWTRTTETKMLVDPVTEIEYPVVEKNFLPGIDFVLAGVAGGALLFGLSFLVRSNKSSEPSSKKSL